MEHSIKQKLPGRVRGVLSEDGTAWQRPQWGRKLFVDDAILEEVAFLPPAIPELALE